MMKDVYKSVMAYATDIANKSSEEVKVGCVITSEYSRIRDFHGSSTRGFNILGVGYNKLIKHEQINQCHNIGNIDFIQHAEISAIEDYFITRDFSDRPKLAFIANKFPCINCTKTLLAIGIDTFVLDSVADSSSKWTESQIKARELLELTLKTIIII